MKNFLSTVKGKVIAGAITLAVIAAAVVVIALLNTGYRTIRVEDLNGTIEITMGDSVKEAVKGQNLKSGCDVFVEEESDLTLELDEDKHVFADELTRFSLEAVGKAGKDSRTVIKLDKGSVLSEIDEKLAADESYVVESANAIMAVRGTTFTVAVSFDEKNLCHTLVEVEDGTVEVTKKDENGNPTDDVLTLEAGEKTEVVSLELDSDENNETSSSDNNSTPDDTPPEDMETVYNDREALAVEAALETFLNGGDLDNTNFDRVTHLEICGKVAVVTLDHLYVGRTQGLGWIADEGGITHAQYSSDTGEMNEIPPSDMIEIPTSGSSLTDLNFLTEMKNLKGLKICFGNITDITPIGQMTQLSYLNLERNNISDITPLENLTNLHSLDMDNNQISDISSLNKLENLETLHIEYNNISDLSPLSQLTKLRLLDVDYNKNIDLSTIRGLTNVSDLQISGVSIHDLSPFSGLTNLTNLSIGDDNISDLSPISGLTNLTKLYIKSENISDISPIAKLNKLEKLYIYSHSINDYSPLYGLTELKGIWCWDMSDDQAAKLQQALPGISITSY